MAVAALGCAGELVQPEVAELAAGGLDDPAPVRGGVVRLPGAEGDALDHPARFSRGECSVTEALITKSDALG